MYQYLSIVMHIGIYLAFDSSFGANPTNNINAKVYLVYSFIKKSTGPIWIKFRIYFLSRYYIPVGEAAGSL